MELVGKQMVDFKDQQTGQQIKGIKLHFLCPDNNVSGQAAMTQFIRADNVCFEKAEQMEFGEFNLLYGPKGRVVDVLKGDPVRK